MLAKWLKEPTDWSDVERLEQRIRDLRMRIREAKNTQEQFFPSSRMDTRVSATTTVEEIRFKSLNTRASLGEGSEVSKEFGYGTREAENLKRKLLGLD